MAENVNSIDISSFKHLYPFKSNYMDRNGLKYHYIDEGKGEPIVMLHGNPTWSFFYRELIKNLSPEYRAIAVDHVGCGLSDKPDEETYDYRLKSRVGDFETFVEHLGLGNNITLVVHDWGGMIGLAYALKHMEKIKRVVIMNTAGFFPPGSRRIPLRLWLIRNIEPFARVGVLGFNMFAFAALFMAPFKKMNKDIKAGLIAPYNNWHNRIATLKFVQDIPLNKSDPSYDIVNFVDENLYRLRDIPVLICWGKHDFVFTETYLDEWKKRLPHADINEFSNAGHYILEDVPGEVIVKIKNFCNENSITQ